MAENNIIREGGSQDIKELMIITIYFIAQITPGTKLHLYTNFQDDRSTDLGANPGQTNKQTDKQTNKQTNKQTVATSYIDNFERNRLFSFFMSLMLRDIGSLNEVIPYNRGGDFGHVCSVSESVLSGLKPCF